MWITSEDKPIPGRIVTADETPRSYVVETESGELRRNRSQIVVVPESEPDPAPETEAEPEQRSALTTPPRRIMTRTRTGTSILPPERLA